jgi:hypothetical protein
MSAKQIKPNNYTERFFSNDITNFLIEKWKVATEFPENKNITNQILAINTLQNYIISTSKNKEKPRQIEDFENILKLVRLIQECKNLTIHTDYKIYIDDVFISIISSNKNNYNSIYSIDTEEEIIKLIKIKKRNRIIRKICSFGLA